MAYCMHPLHLGNFKPRMRVFFQIRDFPDECDYSRGDGRILEKVKEVLKNFSKFVGIPLADLTDKPRWDETDILQPPDLLTFHGASAGNLAIPGSTPSKTTIGGSGIPGERRPETVPAFPGP